MKKQLVSILSTVLILAGVFSIANATTFRFDTDPFAGSTALTTPGRQIVGGETFISFDIASDIFSLESTVFSAGNQVLFAKRIVVSDVLGAQRGNRFLRHAALETPCID